jgi:asparagine synthase (glutamine-hydrolysing)
VCGIAGVFAQNGPPVTAEELEVLAERVRWRGPDDEGYLMETRAGRRHLFAGPDSPPETYAGGLPYTPSRFRPPPGTEGLVGFAFRRLSILDLSPSGHQPMCDPSGRWWLVFNGEVYNYVELRRELERCGHRFLSSGDAAVLLASYAEWGLECFERWNGMWGVALWDAAERRLVLSRDRFGVKPLYYQIENGRLRFASELKPLVLDRPVQVDERSVYDLVARDWVDYRDETFFAGVRRVPPAHVLVAERGEVRLQRYWDLAEGAARRAAEVPAGERPVVDAFRARFEDAVRLRLRSDVPVGTCLSGGLDSSAIVTEAARQLDHPLSVFTVGYADGRYDERRHARAVAEAAGADYHEVEPRGEDLFEVFERIVWHQEEPAAGPGLYSQWHVMRLAHDHGMKVLLDGQGGDELLAGYHRYAIPHLRDLARHGRLAEFARDVWRVGRRQGHAETWAKVALDGPGRPVYEWGRRLFGQGKERVVHPDLAARHAAPEPRPPHRFATALADVLGWEITLRFLPSLLRYEDRNSMAHSIETRLPFLDVRLVEFVFALPDAYRLRGTTTKWILREALSPRLPAAVAARRDKMGYETPTDLWFRGRERRRVQELLLSPDARSRAYLWQPALRRQLDAYFAGRRDIGLQVWRWLHLELWLRAFAERKAEAVRMAS